MKLNSVSGLACYVEDVDRSVEFYEAILAHGMKPSGEPGKGRSGNREFVLRDPDGYRLVFFEK